MPNKTQQYMSASRQRLELMHIDLWALREQATQSITPQVWRDQLITDQDQHSKQQTTQLPPVALSGLTEVELAEQKIRSNEQIHQSQNTPMPVVHATEASLATILEKPLEPHADKAHLDHQHFDMQTTQTQNVHFQADHSVAIQRFDWQFCILPQLVLLIDTTDWLQTNADTDGANAISAQQRLWQNIIQGLHGQSLQLQWPPVIQQWQAQRGQPAYVAGFLAAYASHKNILLLGHMPTAYKAMLQQSLSATHQLIEMPSLAEMLLNWRFKQNLWLKIREYNTAQVMPD